MNKHQVEIMDAMVEMQEYILAKQEVLLVLLRERKSLLVAKEDLERSMNFLKMLDVLTAENQQLHSNGDLRLF